MRYMVSRPTIRTKEGNIFNYFLAFNFYYFLLELVQMMLIGITSYSSFESEISLDSMKLSASPMIE